MSEEILKALMQLFAIVSKQDDGASDLQRKYVEEFLYSQLNAEQVSAYLISYDEFVGPIPLNPDGTPKKRRTSMKESAITIGICQKINQTLTKKQKVVVLVRLFELIAADRNFSEQRMLLLQTVSEAFNFSNDEFASIETFVIKGVDELGNTPGIMLISQNRNAHDSNCKHMHSAIDGHIAILKTLGSEIYFMRYFGESELLLNGLPVNPKRIYIFAQGATIKVPNDKPIYYSDVLANYLSDSNNAKISLSVKNLEYKFPNGKIGLRDINIFEGAGKLIGIMGASGAGKTTLLNVLAGIEHPSNGSVKINGIDLHKNNDRIKSVIGYIPQDDLLIEELTVFENLYYNARLCCKDLTEENLLKLIDKTLTSLGLFEVKDLKVGSPLDKKISGGQRKRLNIALELIREPSVMFVDEPTSGLSSRDSENVMDLLRELTLRGKLIFVVIHQPSSDIYKMFDKIIFLDVGGFMIYYGNPVEAVSYFKKADNQANVAGDCPTCGNVNTELIFNIIEAKVVDDYGNVTGNRKVLPHQWNDLYLKNKISVDNKDLADSSPPSLNLPTRLTQFFIYTARDLRSKLANRQYLVINLLEAPLLAFILSFIIRYIARSNSSLYIFRENDNVPPYIFMSIIVLLFIGLSVSAEEIFRDRKIMKREALLSLSRSSYLLSKVLILFSLSAIQSFLFVVIGNSIIGVKGLYMDYWLMLFSISCFANMLGLNISATFNSAVTIYILIPILIIPQMILGGAMFSYSKLNRVIGGGQRVPFIAELMTARWGYEGLMVEQFTHNQYENFFYESNRKLSQINYKQTHFISELKNIATESKRLLKKKSDSSMVELTNNLEILHNELTSESAQVKTIQFNGINKINPQNFTAEIADLTNEYLDRLQAYYNSLYTVAETKKDLMLNKMLSTSEKADQLRNLYNNYYNDYVADLCKANLEKEKVIRGEGKLIQVVDPIYLYPSKSNILNFKAHFFAPKKYFFGKYIDTFIFNMSIIWLFSLLLYISLYFEWLKKLLNIFENKSNEQ